MAAQRRSLTAAVDLLRAIEDNELFLEYQAVIDLREQAAPGLEGLLRWQHPSLGRLPPAEFLPNAEHLGIGDELTGWVLERATTDLQQWLDDGLDVSISVNISAGDLRHGFLPSSVAALIESRLDRPDRLTLEITERRCPVEDDDILSALKSLARLGVRLSLDDFGMGDSSLARLQRFHFDELKLDRSFITEVTLVPTDREIVASVTALAHSLGMTVVAEGVESGAALDLLRRLDVDRAQGFYLHRPAAASMDRHYI